MFALSIRIRPRAHHTLNVLSSKISKSQSSRLSQLIINLDFHFANCFRLVHIVACCSLFLFFFHREDHVSLFHSLVYFSLLFNLLSLPIFTRNIFRWKNYRRVSAVARRFERCSLMGIVCIIRHSYIHPMLLITKIFRTLSHYPEYQCHKWLSPRIFFKDLAEIGHQVAELNCRKWNKCLKFCEKWSSARTFFICTYV